MRSAHELIPSTNCVDAHVQDTAVNDELLLNTLQAFAERPGSLQATRNSCLFQSVGSSKTVRRSYQQQYCITPYSQELPPPREAHLAVYVLYVHKTEKTETHMFKLKESRVGAIKNKNKNKTQTTTTKHRTGSGCHQPCRPFKYRLAQISEPGLL